MRLGALTPDSTWPQQVSGRGQQILADGTGGETSDIRDGSTRGEPKKLGDSEDSK